MRKRYEHITLSLTEEDLKLKEELEALAKEKKSFIGIFRMGLFYLTERYSGRMK